MLYTFTCKKVNLNDSIKEYTQKKFAKLERYFKNEAQAYVTFAVEKDHRCVVEVTIKGGNMLYRTETEAKDGNMRGAIDAAASRIDAQIRKNKTRLSDKLRTENVESNWPDVFEIPEEQEFVIARVKKFPLKPMTPEEAILQMNLLDHNFFVFQNSQTETTDVVYKRKNGDYGLISTANE